MTFLAALSFQILCMASLGDGLSVKQVSEVLLGIAQENLMFSEFQVKHLR